MEVTIAALDRQGVSTSCGDSVSLGPGDVYEATSPNYPNRYPSNAEWVPYHHYQYKVTHQVGLSPLLTSKQKLRISIRSL